MAFLLIINDENNLNILTHVANSENNSVQTNITEFPQQDWESASNFMQWVRDNKPEWMIVSMEFNPKQILNPALGEYLLK